MATGRREMSQYTEPMRPAYLTYLEQVEANFLHSHNKSYTGGGRRRLGMLETKELNF